MSTGRYLVFLGPDPDREALLVDHLTDYAAMVHGDDVEIRVVRVDLEPDLAAEHRVIATPLIVRTLPLPARRVVGMASDFDTLVDALGAPTRRRYPLQDADTPPAGETR